MPTQTEFKGIKWMVKPEKAGRVEVVIDLPKVDPLPDDVAMAFRNLAKTLEKHGLEEHNVESILKCPPYD